MILKRGVTGYTAGDLSLERDWTVLHAAFKKASYAALQAVNGRVVEWFEPDAMIGYAHARVEVNGQELYIFYNGMYDYIAFTTNKLLTDLQFVDHSALGQAFEGSYQVLTVAQLEEPLRKQKKGDGHLLLNDNDLNDVELYYMDYFPAQTVGDLVFNYWD